MSFFKDPISLGELIDKNLYKAIGPKTSEGLDAILVIKAWHEILGSVMVRYSYEESFEKGKLTVRISSSVLRNDLFLQRIELIKRLNVKLGRNLVFSIVLR